MRHAMRAFAALAMATMAGCAARPAIVPIENQDRYFEYEGFRFLPPSGGGWGMIQSHEFSNPLALAKDLGAPNHTVVAEAEMVIVPEQQLKGKSPAEVLQFVAHAKIERQLAQEKEKNRFALVESESMPPHNGGRSCLGWHYAFDDRGVPRNEGKLYRLAGEFIACAHPDDSSQVLVLDYSERFEASATPPSYMEEGRRFLRSLDFLPLRYQVSSWQIGTSLQDVRYAHGSLWISDSKDNAVYRLDPKNPEAPSRVAVGRNPLGLAEVPAGVMAANEEDGSVSLIDPAGQVLRTVPLGGHPVALGLFGGVLTVCNAPDGGVSVLDAASLSATRIIREISGNIVRLHVRWCNTIGTELWVSTGDDQLYGIAPAGAITRIDPIKGEIIARIMFQPGITRQMLVHDRRVWITFPAKGAVHALDAASRDKLLDIPIQGYPAGIAAYDGAIWVAALRAGAVLRFDPQTGARIGRPLLVARGVGGMTVADGSLWIANARTGSLVRVTSRGQ